VTALTKDVIRSLASFDGDGHPVVSLYLDVDGRRYIRPRDYELQLEHLLRQARRAKAEDLGRIEAHVKAGFDRSRVRGLALFSCQDRGLWEAITLPVPVRNEIVVNQAPQVRPLELVLEEYEHFGVLLADRQRARMLVFELGELADRSELFDQLPRHEDDGGEWDRDHVHDHQASAARHHLRRAALVAFQVFQSQGFEHLIIGAPDEITGELERELHPWLRDRIVARLSVPVGAPEEEIRRAALQVEEQVERAKQAALVERLREQAAVGRAVTGLGPVLAAVVERRMDTLLISDGYVAAGWRCPACRHLATKGRTCPICGSPMDQLEDVVEEAVEDAVQQSCRVVVCTGNADLDVLGRIGALLRF